MQTGRFMLAVVLMIATVVVVNLIFPPPSPVPPPARPLVTDSSSSGPADSARPSAPTPTTPVPRPAVVEAPPMPSAPASSVDTVVVESPLYRYGISTRGAALVSAELLKFKSETRSGPVQLAPNTPRGLVSYHVRNESEIVDFATLEFSVDRRSDLTLRETDQSGTLRFTALDPASRRTVEVAYTFVPLDYRI